MKIEYLIALLGGLSLFLYGMKLMGDGLELVAGTKMQGILEKLTTNKYLGMLLGIIVTAIIQSSSATTVMVVGFVNAGLMNLTQAIGVIMGANIGTTVTGQLIALDINKVAPLIAFVGLVLILFTKKQQLNYLGQVIIGLGMLFIGMGTMSDAMAPLREVPAFGELMTNFKNPLFGVLIGAIVTCIIQSSSASVGILQAMAAQGLIGIGGAMYVIFGQNIGTCITAFLSSIGSNKNGKRAALCHILFNTFGAVFFIIISFILPLDTWFEAMAPGNTVKQIANLHTIFNIVTAILLLPISSLLGKIAMRLVPGEDKEDNTKKLEFLNNCNYHDVAATTIKIEAEVGRMFRVTKDNLYLSMSEFNTPNKDTLLRVNTAEETINFLNHEIKRAIVKINAQTMNKDSALILNRLLNTTSNLERIADHAQNIAEHTKVCLEKKLSFSDAGLEELGQIRDDIQQMIDIISTKSLSKSEKIEKVYFLESQVDKLTEDAKKKHIDRMTDGGCNIEAGILYDEILTDLERVADHLMNIATA